jgi:hypothetical protein
MKRHTKMQSFHSVNRVSSSGSGVGAAPHFGC